MMRIWKMVEVEFGEGGLACLRCMGSRRTHPMRLKKSPIYTGEGRKREKHFLPFSRTSLHQLSPPTKAGHSPQIWGLKLYSRSGDFRIVEKKKGTLPLSFESFPELHKLIVNIACEFHMCDAVFSCFWINDWLPYFITTIFLATLAGCSLALLSGKAISGSQSSYGEIQQRHCQPNVCLCISDLIYANFSFTKLSGMN